MQLQLELNVDEKKQLEEICENIETYVKHIRDAYCGYGEPLEDGFTCSCYNAGTCILTRETAACPHYDECCSGTKMVVIKNSRIQVEDVELDWV